MNIATLRISITDRCNQRCRYCMPAKGIPPQQHSNILRYEESLKLIRIIDRASALTKVRITGGEPFVRKGAVGFVRMLAEAFANVEICATTNGTFGPTTATELKHAGLSRINVSLDTLQPDRYRWLTRGGDLDEAIRGIRSARDAGLEPVKVNSVLIADFNEDQIEPLVTFAAREGVVLRFLELMSTGEAARFGRGRFLSGQTVLDRLGSRYELTPLLRQGTSLEYRVKANGLTATVGLIRPVSDPFCDHCDRLRLDTLGVLRSCLHGPDKIDLGAMLRSGLDEGAIAEAVREFIANKRCCGTPKPDRWMSAIGG